MKIGVFTVLFGQKPFEETLDYVVDLGLGAVEIGTGAYPGNAMCNPAALLASDRRLKAFKEAIDRRNLVISALSCHGNPLHPNAEVARLHREVHRKTVLLAEALEVPVVVDFSGCPGDSPTATAPNWVTCPWPPDFLDTLRWQWDEVVAPYWVESAKFAADHGVKIAIEMHPGFVVYSPETMLKLRGIAGPQIGANLDPSHLFWQGIDPIAAIRVLRDAIHYVHAKDTQIFAANLPKTGVLDTKPYTDERERGWIFRTCGYGHGEDWWREFVSTLRLFGYDYVLSIEHEDSLMSAEEGLTKAASFLSDIVVREQPGVAWWV